MKRIQKIIILGSMTLLFAGFGAGKKPVREMTQLELDAIRWKESSGLEDSKVKDGDDGKAIGPFQLWEIYWRDAVTYDKTLADEPGETYAKCRERAYAELVVRAYMRRWAKSNATFREVAMLHNGGCCVLGKEKDSDAYKNAAAYAAIVTRNLQSLQKGETPKNK